MRCQLPISCSWQRTYPQIWYHVTQVYEAASKTLPAGSDCIIGSIKRAFALAKAAATGDLAKNPTGAIPSGLSILYPNTRRVAATAEEEVEQSGIPELEVGFSRINLGSNSGATRPAPFFRHYHGQFFSRYIVAPGGVTKGIVLLHLFLGISLTDAPKFG